VNGTLPTPFDTQSPRIISLGSLTHVSLWSVDMESGARFLRCLDAPLLDVLTIDLQMGRGSSDEIFSTTLLSPPICRHSIFTHYTTH
jgi:hypothetical protein